MRNTKQQKELLGRFISKLEAVSPYADALYSENVTRRFAKDSTDIEYTSHADAGVKIRAFDGKVFHEICVQGWQPELLASEVQRLAAALKERPQEGKLLALKLAKEQLDKDFTTIGAIDPRTRTVKEKTAAINELHARVLRHPGFANCQVSYREEEEHRVFVSKTKRLSSTWIGCTLAIVPFMTTPDGTRHDYLSAFANGAEVLTVTDAQLAEFLARATQVARAKRITPGTYTVVMSPTVTGLLAHESFGHGMEADTMAHGRARAAGYIGKRLAAAKVNICEDASLEKTHGYFHFDDEGMIPKRVFLVERGVVKQPITDLFSASVGGYPRTANGRAESFDHKGYARMSNTFFLPGSDDPKAMIKGVKDGLYLHTAGSGMEDPKGWGVQIAGILAERIKNGKRTGEFFYEASMTGFLPDILANITHVGKDFEIEKDAGFCGKNHKEWVRVSSGGPHLLITKVSLS